MRLSRRRAAMVLLVAVLHVGAGAVSALGVCCSEPHRAKDGPMMECCVKGGPNHVCPFMSKSKRSKTPGRINVYCPAGHDNGVPVTGLVALPEPAIPVVQPSIAAPAVPATQPFAVARSIYPPTPPPRQLL